LVTQEKTTATILPQPWNDWFAWSVLWRKTQYCIWFDGKKKMCSVLVLFPVLFPMHSIDSWLKQGCARDTSALWGRSKACSNSTGGPLRTASVQWWAPNLYHSDDLKRKYKPETLSFPIN
jgi:hypothetical protein